MTIQYYPIGTAPNFDSGGIDDQSGNGSDVYVDTSYELSELFIPISTSTQITKLKYHYHVVYTAVNNANPSITIDEGYENSAYLGTPGF